MCSSYWKRSRQVTLDYSQLTCLDWPIGIIVRVFVSGLGYWVQSQIENSKKMEFDACLLNIQYYKVQFKGKWNNPGKRVASSPTVWCSSPWKGSLQVSQHTYLLTSHPAMTFIAWCGCFSETRKDRQTKGPKKTGQLPENQLLGDLWMT